MPRKFLIIVISAVFLPLAVSLASTTNGTIDTNYKYAWGENLGWVNFGCDYCNVQVTDSGITGYAWSRQYGWINLSPTNGGVTNTSEGVLGGNAWSSNLGWITFSGATINSSGKFTGTAGTSGSKAGRISFDCANCNVATDWRPASARTSSETTGGGTGGGGSSLIKKITETSTGTGIDSDGYKNWFNNVVSRADVVKDGVIDLIDFNTLMVQWGRAGASLASDINGDEAVDLLDFNQLMVKWGQRYTFI
jgi:hypothetical protein